MFRDLLSDPTRQSSLRFRPVVEALEDRTVAVATTTTLNALTLFPRADRPILLIATVDATGTVDAGAVTFLDGATEIARVSSVSPAGGRASVFVSLPAGLHNLTARFEGSATADPSTSAVVPLQVRGSGLLENVTDRVAVSLTPLGRRGLFVRRQRVRVTLRNTSGAAVQGPFLLDLRRLPRSMRVNAPFGLMRLPGLFGRRFVPVAREQLNPGETITFNITVLGSLERRPFQTTTVYSAGGLFV